MTEKDLVRKLQKAIGVKEDGDFGPVTEARTTKFNIDVIATEKPEEQKQAPATAVPWLDEAKKHTGKKESDSAFNKYLSGFWRIVGLPSYKTIIGTSFAWCGLFVATVLFNVGMPVQKGGAGAKNWAKYGQEIEWKKDGIPRGAIIHLDHDQDCRGGGNHVTLSDGDCAPDDLSKSGATVNGFGGNQGNTVKVSAYSVKEICAVRWPPEVPLPPRVVKSMGCSGKASGESTR